MVFGMSTVFLLSALIYSLASENDVASRRDADLMPIAVQRGPDEGYSTVDGSNASAEYALLYDTYVHIHI